MFTYSSPTVLNASTECLFRELTGEGKNGACLVADKRLGRRIDKESLEKLKGRKECRARIIQEMLEVKGREMFGCLLSLVKSQSDRDRSLSSAKSKPLTLDHFENSITPISFQTTRFYSFAGSFRYSTSSCSYDDHSHLKSELCGSPASHSIIHHVDHRVSIPHVHSLNGLVSIYAK